MSPRDPRNKDTQRTNVPVETTTFNALVSQCDGVGSDSEVAPCTKACSKSYATLKSHYDKLTNDLRKSQFDVLSYKTGLESVESRLVVYQQNENVFEEDIKLLKLDVMLRDNALVELRKKFEKGEKEIDELKLKLEKFQTSSKNLNESVPTSPVHDSETAPTVIYVEPSLTNPTKELSQSNRPSAPIIKDWVSDSQDEYEGEHMPTQKAPSFVQTTEHVKTPRTFVKPVEHTTPAENLRKDIPKSRGHRHSWNRKACFVCKSLNHLIKDCDYYEKKMVQKPIWNHAMRVNHQHSARMTHPHSKKHVVPTAVLARSRLVPLNAVRPVTTTVPQTNVQHQRPIKHVFNKPHSPIRRPINHRSSPTNSNFHHKVTTVQAKQGNPHQALKDKGVIDSGCSRHMTRNISYLFDFEKINRGYNAFGRNPKGGKITGKDPLGKFDGKADEGLLVGYSVSSKAFRVFNSRTRIVQETLHINFLENQPNIAGSEPTWLFDIDTLTQSMNYQPVVAWNQPNSSAGIQENLDAEFFVNSTNMVNAASASVTAVGPNSTNSTNSFNVVGLSDNVVSPTFEIGGKSSFVDPSQYLDDPNMPALEDIVYSDDEKDVGAEANFSNLETSITVSHIPTTRIHKDHPVTQIIGDLSSAPQTRSMTKMVKEQGGLTQINDEDFHTCMFACFHSQEEPKRVHQALKDPSWIEAMQEELLQFKIAWYETLANYLLENSFQRGKIDQTLFIKKQKGDILLVQIYVDDIIFASTNKELCKAFEKLMNDKFQMSSMGELTFFLGLQVKKKNNGILISQDKYVAKILRKFGLTDGKLASTSIDTEKPLLKDPDGEDVDVHIYRSMIGSLMYLTLSRPDIMFAVCACTYFKVTLKVSHLHAVKRIFRLISWQCKKQTVVATSSTEAEYVADASYYAQVLWIQNQLMDCGLTMQVKQHSMKLLEWTVSVKNVSSAGLNTTPQMVINSPCLTHIKN
nr:hypothetical protein [Tanacetum cinerariifolium]